MISFPSHIIPSFEKEIEAKMTMGEVFGGLAFTNFLDKAVEKIRAGQYSLSREAAQELGVKTTGTFALSEWAAMIFIMECSSSNPDWARAQGPGLPERVGVEWAQLSKMRIWDMWQKLAVTSPSSPEGRQETSHGAQGQTRKRGSHRDGSGHR